MPPPLPRQRADFGVRRTRARHPNGAGTVTTPPGGEQFGSRTPWPAGPDAGVRAAPGRPARPSALVRPYAMTGGRTRPSHQLALEALVSTATPLTQPVAQPPEAYRIRLLCQEVKSVAEISAHLSLPLGVARILVADLAEAGLVVIQQPGGDDADGGRPHVTLLERVLSGLRRL
ncbi:DUF742 domain-containing protein [Streptomyces sp. NPDC026665]|uniref:DUF742 domain-containing protein n=1 Tax=Streptomyces sp. NPDC026665 TaxID=3154798 RepID=UPI0033EBA5E7